MKYTQIFTQNKTFNVRLVEKNERYGLHNEGQLHTEEQPVIEFYDSSKGHTELGKFLGRYSLEYVLSTNSLDFTHEDPVSFIMGEDVIKLRDSIIELNNTNKKNTYKIK